MNLLYFVAIRADVVQTLMDRAQAEAQKVVDKYKAAITEKGVRY